MISSIRRISVALLMLGVFSVSAGTLGLVSSYCVNDANCLASLIGVKTADEIYPALDDTHNSMTTAQVGEVGGFSMIEINQGLQLFGVLLVSVAFLVLTVLEIPDPHYTRRLFHGAARPV